MASVDYKKFKNISSLKAIFRHNSVDKRLYTKHSNKQINKELTLQNTSVFEETSYTDACSKFDERLALLDSTTNTNKRKDRVICMGLVVPLPEGVSYKLSDRWMQRVADILMDYYGAENLVEGFIHRDEVHDYLDAVTGDKRTSLIHGQFYVIPEHEGKLNGKWFSSRENMIKVNEMIDEMSQTEFGVPFLKRNGQKSHGKTEDLKFLSGQLAAEKLAEAEERLKAVSLKEADINERYMALEALERASKDERDKLYDQAEKALKTAQSVSDWGLTDNVIDILRKKRVTVRHKDGSTDSQSYYEVVQTELQRQAAAQQQRQADELHRQQKQRAEAEQRHAKKNKRFGDYLRSGGSGISAASGTNMPQYDNPFEL